MQEKLKIVMVTAPDTKVAEKMAARVIKDGLAACVNIIPTIKSIYVWQNKICKDKEVLMLIKTKTSTLKKLEKSILKMHPYDTAEFVALDTAHVANKYLSWAIKNCG